MAKKQDKIIAGESADYQRMYAIAFNALTDVQNKLDDIHLDIVRAQKQTEELYMEAATDDNEQKFKMAVVGKGLKYVNKHWINPMLFTDPAQKATGSNPVGRTKK